MAPPWFSVFTQQRKKLPTSLSFFSLLSNCMEIEVGLDFAQVPVKTKMEANLITTVDTVLAQHTISQKLFCV